MYTKVLGPLFGSDWYSARPVRRPSVKRQDANLVRVAHLESRSQGAESVAVDCSINDNRLTSLLRPPDSHGRGMGAGTFQHGGRWDRPGDEGLQLQPVLLSAP